MNALIQERSVAAVSIAVLLLVAGCADGSVSKRDDGKLAAAMIGPTESGLYETQVREAALRLMRENPEISRSAAYEKARGSVPVDYEPGETVAEQRAMREKIEAQHKFEEELANLDK